MRDNLSLKTALQACREVNLNTEITPGRPGTLWIYRTDGALLRTFEVRSLTVDERDFRNWFQFMGFDHATWG